jgi:hypothetical protein
MGNRHPPSFAPVLSSSPSSSTQSSLDQSGLPPLSSPWACHVEWFDLHGNSLAFLLDRSLNWPRPRSQWWHVPLVCHPTLLHHPRPPPSPASVPSLDDGNVHSKELCVEVSHNQEQLQPECVSPPGLRDSVSILQELVFVVRWDVDDLWFRLEHLDGMSYAD